MAGKASKKSATANVKKTLGKISSAASKDVASLKAGAKSVTSKAKKTLGKVSASANKDIASLKANHQKEIAALKKSMEAFSMNIFAVCKPTIYLPLNNNWLR